MPPPVVASTPPTGLGCDPVAVDAVSGWVWLGICCTVSVSCSVPAISPIWYVVPSFPVPMWIGTRLARFGRLNVSSPSPPYVVPINWNSTSFSEIGSVCPSQNIHPFGAKFPANMRISPTYGAMVSPLVLRGEDALQGNDEVQHEVRHHVVVRLTPAHTGHRARIHCRQRARRRVKIVDAAENCVRRI